MFGELISVISYRYNIDFSKVTQCSHRIFKTENVLHFVFVLIKSDCRLRSARRGVPFIHNPLAHSSGVSRHLQPFIGCLWVYSWSLLFYWTYDISAYYTRVHLSMPIIASGLMNGLLRIRSRMKIEEIVFNKIIKTRTAQE